MLKRIKLIDNISGLQIFQLMKFTVFLIISIVLTKSHLSRAEIGKWEMFLFIAGLISFFWVTGIIQSLLPLYHRNKTYRKMGDNGTAKSPEIFNAFLLLCFFSLLFFVFGHLLKNNFSVFHLSGNVPYLNLLLLYMLLSSPVCLIEYIYLLNNRSYRIFQYGLYTFTTQLILVLVPVALGKDIIWSVYGLLAITGVRWIWLLILLRRYTEMTISWKFMKEHLYLGTPLILTTLISGSAQYTDGVIVSAVYRDPAMFAWFRYGAKEFPLVLLLANGLSNAMLPEFSTRSRMKESMEKIKAKSKKLMHFLFPVTMVIMLFTRWFYPRLFSPEFQKSADVFLIYTLLANGLSNAMLPEFSTRSRMKESMEKIKAKSKKLMHFLFPVTMVIMLFTRWFYPRLFSPEFQKSADVFLIYTLLIIPRLVFPQTIIVGRKKTHITLIAAILEMGINIPLSLLMIKWGYNIVGVALSTFIVYAVSKMFLTGYVWYKMKIKPSEYIPLKIYGIYCVLVAVLFILIDHRIIDIH